MQGRLAQLVRALCSHRRGHRFEFCIAHFCKLLPKRYLALPPIFRIVAHCSSYGVRRTPKPQGVSASWHVQESPIQSIASTSPETLVSGYLNIGPEIDDVGNAMLVGIMEMSSIIDETGLDADEVDELTVGRHLGEMV